MTNPIIDHLLTRRSVSANSLCEPGPSQQEIEQILTAATRVPDHKELGPRRFMLFQGDARAAFGEVLAETCKREETDPSKFRLETEANRFMRAPLIIAVISRVVKNPAAPEWEQVLSAGAARAPVARRNCASLATVVADLSSRIVPAGYARRGCGPGRTS